MDHPTFSFQRPRYFWSTSKVSFRRNLEPREGRSAAKQKRFDVEQIVETWRAEYNESRPPTTLEEKTPHEFANETAASRDFVGMQTAENSPWGYRKKPVQSVMQTLSTNLEQELGLVSVDCTPNRTVRVATFYLIVTTNFRRTRVPQVFPNVTG